MKRVVVKLGTHILTEPGKGLAFERVEQIASEIAGFFPKKIQVILVSSGAVGLGRALLDHRGEKLSTNVRAKQAAASLGQPMLMGEFKKAFEPYQIVPAQLLLTSDDFTHRERFLNLKATLEQVLGWSCLPIINENDPVSRSELEEVKAKVFGDKVFGDNDKLSALVATKLECDTLVILTDVDGIYTANPKEDSRAKKMDCVQDLEELNHITARGGSKLGRGGMMTKLESARLAALCGVSTVIASGIKKGVLKSVLSWIHSGGDVNSFPNEGTLIVPHRKYKGKKKWLRFSSSTSGSVSINEGALLALQTRGASLLAAGVTEVTGRFDQGAVVSILDPQGVEVGRGLVSASSQEIESVRGQKRKEVIHRDDLVMMGGYAKGD